ncbi:MAG: aminopeptidase N [Gammaproteobacteria bacterium]
MKNLTYVILALSFSAQAGVNRPNEDVITQAFAKERKEQVKSVEYDLDLSFEKTSEEYSGTATLRVVLNLRDLPLSLDTTAKTIESVTVNSKPVANYVKRKGSIDIPARSLSKSNVIVVKFKNDFNKDGNGIQRVIDPEDQSVYIYTDFEPYFAHTAFPCLDQPDLKATFGITVTAPADWKIVSNDLAVESKVFGEKAVTKFNRTKPISTYLFFIGMGPFAEWTDKYRDIPLTLHARKTQAKYVDADRLFEVTKKGLQYYEEFFATPYPFPKFGQLFIPEFAWGGMENPGAITLNERNLFRGVRPESEYESRDELILHEMAHMWFGDYVTMQWWDDLWLNESFASYLATLSGKRAMNAKGVAMNTVGEKGWGYWQDQLVTTHPIETPVPDTRVAKGNFDGITYAKGSATLAQLHFFVGEAGFKEGLKNYFHKYAFSNTKRADFVSEIGSASKTSLDHWTRAWLQTAGPNRVSTQWSCADGKIQSFQMVQEPSVSKTLSPHKTRLGTFMSQDGNLVQDQTSDVTYAGATGSVRSLVGKPCPDFVFPNLENFDYALFSLDERSLKFARKVLQGAVQDAALRMMTWQILEQMVRDAKLTVNEYLVLALAGLEKETDEALLAVLLGTFSPVKSIMANYLTPSERAEFSPKMESLLWKRLQAQPAGSNLQMTFWGFYNEIATSKEALDRLKAALDGKDVPAGLDIDQDRRWAIVQRLAVEGYPGVSAIIDATEKQDPSTVGKRNAYAARVAIPEQKSKALFWKALEKSQDLPFSTLRAASLIFHSPDAPAVSESYVDRFFQRISAVDWEKNDNIVEIYLENLFPGTLCSPTLLSRSEREMKRSKGLTSLARRTWLEANDDLKRCVNIRAKNAKDGKRQVL